MQHSGSQTEQPLRTAQLSIIAPSILAQMPLELVKKEGVAAHHKRASISKCECDRLIIRDDL